MQLMSLCLVMRIGTHNTRLSSKLMPIRLFRKVSLNSMTTHLSWKYALRVNNAEMMLISGLKQPSQVSGKLFFKHFAQLLKELLLLLKKSLKMDTTQRFSASTTSHAVPSAKSTRPMSKK